jgi:uncharacterized protein with PQ loop repeat
MWISVPYIKRTFFKVKNWKKKITTTFLLIGSFGLLAFLLYSYVPFIQMLVEKTFELDQERAEAGLTGVIFTLPWYFRFPSKLLFIIGMPYPGLGSFEQAFQGLGTLIQLIFTPVAFYGAIKGFRIENLQEITIWFFFFLLLIGLGSVDFKHKPTIILFGSILVVYGLRYFRFK